MRIYYKKKFWAGVGALLLGLALPGTCLFVGWERFDLKDAVLTMFMVLSGISRTGTRTGTSAPGTTRTAAGPSRSGCCFA